MIEFRKAMYRSAELHSQDAEHGVCHVIVHDTRLIISAFGICVRFGSGIIICFSVLVSRPFVPAIDDRLVAFVQR